MAPIGAGFPDVGAYACALAGPLVFWHLQPDERSRPASPLFGALFYCILSGLCSFVMASLMLGNLLDHAWIPAFSGGMTMTSARLDVVGQYIVRPHPQVLQG